jgi:hypothetical protein
LHVVEPVEQRSARILRARSEVDFGLLLREESGSSRRATLRQRRLATRRARSTPTSTASASTICGDNSGLTYSYMGI